MITTSARLLRLVSLLSSRPTWSNAELARKLDVTERTVRRDVDKLRELGYGVESVPGPGGGYRFGAGNRMPPLNLDDDEVFAVAVALREAAHGAALGADPAALSALLKLRQILPTRMARRLSGLDATVEHTPRCETPRASADVLLLLASVCRASERTTLTYRDMHGTTTVRCVDPHRLVYTGAHWYFVARDVGRSAWRTFRADRVVEVVSTGEVVEVPDAPDAAQLVSDTITRTGYPFFARVRLPLSYDDARRLVTPIVATHEPDGPNATVISIGGSDPDQLAGYLLSLRTPLEVLSPDSVREALLARLDVLYRGNGAGRQEADEQK
ncbi:helix-turn-helix transcriptional regulator [Streptomyces griseus]|uniref:helix-turn-helix transcriptional regulator n=1 Tax=Streptomyces griseus TaxID=1911 RepID=UPI00225A738C|nr:YafY family protein [Streptomyces griseus]MCX4708622.1 YafY family transcriptional regulator [Streptomyces griseus]